MDFQYDYEDGNLSFQDNNDDDNAYDSINPQHYNDEMIFSQDDINSSDTEEKEESDNDYNSEEKEVDDNEINDEEEEGEGNNDDNEVEEERNNDEEERNGEEEEIHQIIEALDKDEIPSCDGEFAPYEELQQCLEEEFSILPKVFVKDKYSIEEQAQDNDDTKVVSPHL
ncbi:hypothetical protein GLOIN_2v1479904 [Rhizophagus clarus]|uniref:Uncharacterized protein n=1 Tax=Rhizophagus clarus TaxID=94130 RepID=A0A8H3QZY6_9GLOM|nr:hypothetical protein GLOIN_2v1479904 [Rhizophagus clarus]